MNSIVIFEELDGEGNVIEESYGVKLTGDCADEYGIDEDYFTAVVDAYEFAEEVSKATNTPVTWDCYKPGWAN